jgi:hypothetical protein
LLFLSWEVDMNTRRVSRRILLAALLFHVPSILGAQGTPGGGTPPERLRARLLATRIGTELTVTLDSGDLVQGELADVADESFGIWVKPDEAARRRLHLTSGRLKKRIAYQDISAIEGAGSVAQSGSELAYRMRVGDTVRLRTGDGREVRGRVDDFDGDLLRIDSRSFHLSSGEVQRIERKVDDPVTNGALIGLGIGAGWIGLVCASYGGCDGEAIVPGLVVAGGGAGLGALIDALYTHREVVYVSPSAHPPKKLEVSPILTRDRKGLLFSLHF